MRIKFEMHMCVFLSIYFISLSKPSQQHFKQSSDFCFLASICNHTSIPVCGKEKKELNRRLFQDECDLMEYNCDYKKEYIETSFVECQRKNKYQTMYIQSTPDTSIKSSISEERSTEKSNNSFKSTIVESSSIRNIMSTIKSESTSGKNKHKNESNGKCTCHLFTTRNVNVTKTNIKNTSEISTKHVTSSDDKTIKITNNNEVTSRITDTTAQHYSQTPSPKSCTRKKLTTPYSPHDTLFTKTVTESVNNSATVPSSTTVVTIQPTEFTLNMTYSIHKNIETRQTIKDATSPVNNSLTNFTNTNESKLISTKEFSPVTSIIPCVTKTYPKDCDRPFSWETTAKGETRDFYQILRARYGDRMKMFKGTTNWPRRVYSYKNVIHDFIRDRHNET